jgi:hypothetical protein
MPSAFHCLSVRRHEILVSVMMLSLKKENAILQPECQLIGFLSRCIPWQWIGWIAVVFQGYDAVLCNQYDVYLKFCSFACGLSVGVT